MKAISLILIFLEILPLRAANIPVGIGRLGEYPTSDERASLILEKRLQRWVENSDFAKLETKSLSKVLKHDEFVSEIQQLRFNKLLTEIETQFKGKTDLKKLQPKMEQMKEMRRKIELNSDLSPLVQKSCVLESLYAWKKKDKKTAETLLRRAARIHPEATIPSFFAWDKLEGESSEHVGFEVLIDKAVSMQSRGCRILIKSPEGQKTVDEVYVNGFKIGRKKELHLNSGLLYRISKGPEFEQSLVRCERQSNQKVSLPSKKQPLSKTKQFLLKEGVLSSFFIENEKSEFKLSLFTPGVGYDELPLDKPLKKAEITQNPMEEGIPVSKQAVSKILESHRVASLKMQALLPAGHPSPVMVSHLDHKVEESKKWYNSWAFWAITGTILAGASVAYFASRNNNGGVEVTKSNVGAKIE